MTIPLSQLQTWSSQGSVTQSKNTYATVRAALEEGNATYKDRNFKVFLQGSYGNDTNIYAESDMDVVIRYDGAFYHDIDQRPADEHSCLHMRHILTVEPISIATSRNMSGKHCGPSFRIQSNPVSRPSGSKATTTDATGTSSLPLSTGATTNLKRLTTRVMSPECVSSRQTVLK